MDWRNWLIGVISGGLLAWVMTAVAAGRWFQRHEDNHTGILSRVAELEQEHQALQELVRDTQTCLQSVRGAINIANNELSRLTSTVETLMGHVNTLTGQVATLNAWVGDLRRDSKINP